jgi:hypothetical protein
MSLNKNNVVITISGPIRSGKTVIAAVIKKALLDAGVPVADIQYGTTGIYANKDSRTQNARILKDALEAVTIGSMRPEEYPHPRLIHILEDTSDVNVVMSESQLFDRGRM